MQISEQGTALKYGFEDSSYKAAGELAGITRLVDCFYDYMESLPEAKTISEMHPNLTEARKKLSYFLSGWLGGPKLYSQNYGSIAIPKFHQHLPIGAAEHDAWLLCMDKAIDDQSYEDSFKKYLKVQLRVPAGRVKAVCAKQD